jgi:hypothetical protein
MFMRRLGLAVIDQYQHRSCHPYAGKCIQHFPQNSPPGQVSTTTEAINVDQEMILTSCDISAFEKMLERPFLVLSLSGLSRRLPGGVSLTILYLVMMHRRG